MIADTSAVERVSLRQATDPALSARAHARGLHTVSDLKRAVLRQRPQWWLGASYHCAICDVNYADARKAAEHVVLAQHPVLRMD